MSGIDLEIQATHCIEEIGQKEWDAFSAGRPFSSYDWYRYGECAMANCNPFYVSVTSHGQTIARASFWLVREEPLPLSARLLRTGLERFLSARPLLVCRSPLSDSGGLILVDSPLRRQALERIVSAAEAFCRSVSASYLVFDYLDADQAGLDDWPDRFSRVQMAEPGTCLAIDWNSFDQYLQGLSKSAWKDYRRQSNQARRLGLEVIIRPAGDLNVEEALPLIRNVEARHGASPKPWASKMLDLAAGSEAIWIEARVMEQLVGCGLLLADGDARLATLLGLDYRVPYVYFQIMYAAIREAISGGTRLLRAGSGAYDFKQRLGFRKETNNYLRFSGQTWLLGKLGRLVSNLS